MMTRVYQEYSILPNEDALFINRDGVRYAVQMLPQTHPLPALPQNKANLLALYSLRVTGMREISTGFAGQTDWTVYVREISSRAASRDKIMLLNDSTEVWIAEIKEWLTPEPATLTATQIRMAMDALNAAAVPFNDRMVRWALEHQAKDLGIEPGKIFKAWEDQ
ncbi:MAG: hypothetical protein ACHQ9S_18720 [Candidatus Binatia bacterium]